MLVDGFSTLFKAIFIVIAALIALVSFEYVERKQLPSVSFTCLYCSRPSA